MRISASDRSVLIRVASNLPKGDKFRREILAALKHGSYSSMTYLRPEPLSGMTSEIIAEELAWLMKERRRLSSVLNRMDDGNSQGRTIAKQLDALEVRIEEITMFTKANPQG